VSPAAIAPAIRARLDQIAGALDEMRTDLAAQGDLLASSLTAIPACRNAPSTGHDPLSHD